MRKDIPWYEWFYKVCHNWFVYNANRRKIKWHKNHKWYLNVCLCVNKVKKNHKVHRLVAAAFLWESNLDVNHIDGKKHNNKLSNLEYISKSDNIKHAFYVLWNWVKSVDQYDLNWKFIQSFDSMAKAARILRLDNSWISKCCNPKNPKKTVWWYIFKYSKWKS